MQQNERTTADGAGMRAAGPPSSASGLTTDRTVAMLLVGAFLALVVIRRGFSGALGD